MKKLYKRQPVHELYKDEDAKRILSNIETAPEPDTIVGESFIDGEPSLALQTEESFQFGSGSLQQLFADDLETLFPDNTQNSAHPDFGQVFWDVYIDESTEVYDGVKAQPINVGGDVIGGTEPDFVDLVEDGKTIGAKETMTFTVNGTDYEIETHLIQ